MSFDAPLPNLFDEDWRSALEARNQPGLGAASYAAPSGSAVPFILRKVSFSGGVSNDTEEYPFFGGWSSTPINEKPQAIKIEGIVRGVDCLKRRNALLKALRVATSDDAPGYIALSSWGRFPVVVEDWDVSEEMDKQGQFPVSLTFTRSGLSDASRQAQTTTTTKSLSTALAAQIEVVQAVFEADLSDSVSTTAMASGFAQLTTALASIVGRVQAVKSKLNAMSAKVQAIQILIDQGVNTPAELAAALYSAVAGIVAGVIGTAEDIDALLSDDSDEDVLNEKNNAYNCALAFLANASYVPDIAVATIKDNATKAAIQNLYRAMSFYAAAAIIPSISDSSYERFKALFALFRTLEDSIDYDDPDLYSACSDLRIAVSQELDALELYQTLSAKLSVPLPVLALVQKLGVSYDTFRTLNRSVSDEFLVQGEVSYV